MARSRNLLRPDDLGRDGDVRLRDAATIWSALDAQAGPRSAFTVPGRLSARGGAVTAGERKVFAALRDHLPEDYLVYYNVRVRDGHPDFIVIGPTSGSSSSR